MMNNYYKNVVEYNELYVKNLLWKNIVEEYLKPIEVDEIRKQIGTFRIEENEDLFRELIALLEILAMHRAKSSQLERRMSLYRTSDTKIQILQSKIQDLALSLNSRTVRKFVESDEKNRKIFEYTDPSTPRNRPKRLKTPRPQSRKSDSSASSGSVNKLSENDTTATTLNLEFVKNELNVFDIDKVLVEVREALNFEKELLLEDIGYLRNLLDNESKFQNEVKSSKPPSIKELEIFEKKLKECAIQGKKEEFLKKLPNLKKLKKKKRIVVDNIHEDGKSTKELKPLKRKSSRNEIIVKDKKKCDLKAKKREKENGLNERKKSKKKKKKAKLGKLKNPALKNKLKLNLEPVKNFRRY